MLGQIVSFVFIDLPFYTGGVVNMSFVSFRILITGETSGLVETVTDAVSVHSIKKGEYAKRLAEGGPIGHVSLMDHYVNVNHIFLLPLSAIQLINFLDIR